LLQPALENTLTHLHLGSTVAATDDLLRTLILRQISLKTLQVPLAPQDLCDGFSFESLKCYLEDPISKQLVYLDIVGHKTIDERFWAIRIAACGTIRIVNARRTSIDNKIGSSQLSKTLLRSRMAHAAESQLNPSARNGIFHQLLVLIDVVRAADISWEEDQGKFLVILFCTPSLLRMPSTQRL
jgi:hypothetical protein